MAGGDDKTVLLEKVICMIFFYFFILLLLFLYFFHFNNFSMVKKRRALNGLLCGNLLGMKQPRLSCSLILFFIVHTYIVTCRPLTVYGV